MLGQKYTKGFMLLMFALISAVSRADDDDHHEKEHENHRENSVSKRGKPSVVASQDPLYKAECGSCHMVYPPGLLPARSWQALMKGLDNHFGETASLDAKESDKIQQFLVSHAADQPNAEKKSRKIAKSIPAGETPLRISDTSYFKKEHREIGTEVWKRKSVVSRANCIACHPGAEMGRFAEREIRIPKS